MNTTVWLISFTDSSGKQMQTVHTHNCVADFRVIDKNATAQVIDCAAVAELIDAAQADVALSLDAGLDCERLRMAIANATGAP